MPTSIPVVDATAIVLLVVSSVATTFSTRDGANAPPSNALRAKVSADKDPSLRSNVYVLPT